MSIELKFKAFANKVSGACWVVSARQPENHEALYSKGSNCLHLFFLESSKKKLLAAKTVALVLVVKAKHDIGPACALELEPQEGQDVGLYPKPEQVPNHQTLYVPLDSKVAAGDEFAVTVEF